ncbi:MULTISPECIES: hypothetical protein [unclassified Lysinibacillus]|uniref:hypothetical protein n=2 Tax=Lysinibacillus TaxID=400634 RepID=UPI0027E25C0F|nr:MULTISPECIES: hypothetical protein [unclassified Lysinibacillus]
MMTTNDIPYISSLAMIDQLKGYLTTEEELAFMQLLFSSSASIKGANYGLRRKELEKLLGIKNDDSALQSFIDRVNGALNRYLMRGVIVLLS